MHTLANLLLTALSTAPSTGQGVTFQPIPGKAVEKTVRSSHVLTVDGFRRTVEGETTTIPMPLRLESEQKTVFVDEYRSIEAGHPAVFRRTYQGSGLTASLRPIGDDQTPPIKVQLDSPIKDASVVFTWIPAEGAYARYCDAAELTERWLPDLPGELDLCGLLPPPEATVGATWSVDAEAIGRVMAAFGEQHFEAPKGMDRMLLRTLGVGVGANLHQAMGGQSSGRVDLKLAAVEGDLARIEISAGRLNFVRDVTDYTADSQLRREEDVGVKPTTGRLVLDLQGHGELVWNRAAGRAQSLELRLAETVSMAVDSDVEGTKITEEMRMSGVFTHRMDVIPAEPIPVPGPVVPPDK